MDGAQPQIERRPRCCGSAQARDLDMGTRGFWTLGANGDKVWASEAAIGKEERGDSGYVDAWPRLVQVSELRSCVSWKGSLVGETYPHVRALTHSYEGVIHQPGATDWC